MTTSPSPFAYPDRTTTTIRAKPFALLPIERWIELELASGMMAPHRLKDEARGDSLTVLHLPRAESRQQRCRATVEEVLAQADERAHREHTDEQREREGNDEACRVHDARPAPHWKTTRAVMVGIA